MNPQHRCALLKKRLKQHAQAGFEQQPFARLNFVDSTGQTQIKIDGSSPKELMILKGFKDSRKTLKNYRDLKVWQTLYRHCLDLYGITKRFLKEGYGR
jgi:hypothetical protein